MLDTQAYQKLFEPSSLPEQNQTACLITQQIFIFLTVIHTF